MPKYTPDDIYRVSREVLPDLPEDMRQIIIPLLERGEAGENTHNLVLKLLTDDPQIRKKFNKLLSDENFFLSREFSNLGGNTGSSLGQEFCCPEPNCTYEYTIGEVGEEPGVCPHCHKLLIPKKEKRRLNHAN